MSKYLVTGTNPDDNDEPICLVCNDTGRWEVEPGEFVACYEGCLSEEERQTRQIQVTESNHPSQIAGVDW